VPADAHVAKAVDLLRVVAARVDAHGAEGQPAAVLGDEFVLERLVQLEPDLALSQIAVDRLVEDAPGLLRILARQPTTSISKRSPCTSTPAGSVFFNATW
jgi:hypothetical protein